MLHQYAYVGILSAVALLFGSVAITLGVLLGPRKPGKVKGSPYECGLETIGDTWVRFRAQYYLYALVFLVFDVEAIFLLPWAVAYHKLGIVALVDATIFILILLVGLVYAWVKKALEWW